MDGLGIVEDRAAADEEQARKFLALAVMGLYGGSRMYYHKKVRTIRESKRCSLAGCDNMTTHNGGYCCSEHCKDDRRK